VLFASKSGAVSRILGMRLSLISSALWREIQHCGDL
jgi:hypothetical protein